MTGRDLGKTSQLVGVLYREREAENMRTALSRDSMRVLYLLETCAAAVLQQASRICPYRLTQLQMIAEPGVLVLSSQKNIPLIWPVCSSSVPSCDGLFLLGRKLLSPMVTS